MNEHKHTSYRTILVVIGVAAIVLFLLLFNSLRTHRLLQSGFSTEETQNGNQLVVGGEVTSVSQSASQIYFMEDLLLEVQGNNVKAKSISGAVTWSSKFDGDITKTITSTNHIVLVDSTGKLYYITKQGKLMWDYNLPYDLTDVFTEPGGLLLIEYNTSGGSMLEIFDEKGHRLGNLNLEYSKILSFSAVKDRNFSISIMDMSEESIKSKIITCNLNGDIIWADNYDKKLVPQVKYNKSGLLIALGEDCLCRYKQEGKKDNSVEFGSDIIKAGLGKNNVGVVSSEMGKYVFYGYDAALKPLFHFNVNEVPDGICVSKNSFVLYNRTNLEVYDTKGKLIETYRSGIDINQVLLSEDNKIYIVSNRKLQYLMVE